MEYTIRNKIFIGLAFLVAMMAPIAAKADLYWPHYSEVTININGQAFPGGATVAIVCDTFWFSVDRDLENYTPAKEDLEKDIRFFTYKGVKTRVFDTFNYGKKIPTNCRLYTKTNNRLYISEQLGDIRTSAGLVNEGNAIFPGGDAIYREYSFNLRATDETNPEESNEAILQIFESKDSSHQNPVLIPGYLASKDPNNLNFTDALIDSITPELTNLKKPLIVPEQDIKPAILPNVDNNYNSAQVTRITLLLSILIESFIALLFVLLLPMFFGDKMDRSKTILTVITATAISQPILSYSLDIILSSYLPISDYFVIGAGEVLVVIFEAIFIALFTKISFSRSLLLSLVINLASYFIGLWIMTIL